MLATQLFISFTIISIIYLLVLQYTKFFSYPTYLAKISLNLNFYFTMVYTICFLLSLVILAVDWYTSTIVEIILQTSPYSPYSPTSPADIPHIVLDENGKSITKPNNNENLPKNPDIVAHTAVEKTKSTDTRWYQWFTKAQYKVEHKISDKLVEALKNPGCTAGHPEMLKASLEGMSSGKQNSLYTGPYTPEQLNITDLNDDSTSVPFFKKTIVNTEAGSSETFECANMRKSVDVYTEKYQHVNETDKFSWLETTLIDVGLKTTGWDKTLCVRVSSDAEKLFTQQNMQARSESDFSPKYQNLWDPSN